MLMLGVLLCCETSMEAGMLCEGNLNERTDCQQAPLAVNFNSSCCPCFIALGNAACLEAYPPIAVTGTIAGQLDCLLVAIGVKIQGVLLVHHKG